MDTREARTLIAQVELISHGQTQAWNPSGGGHNAENPNALPPGELNPPHVRLREELSRALTQTQVDRVANKARIALKQAKYTPPPTGTEPTYGTIHWKRWIASSPESNAELARRFHVSPQYIGQVRKQYGSAAA